MSTEVLEDVGARVDGVVDVEVLYRACRSRDEVARACQHDGRTVVRVGKS